jgi:hypothetical protein
MGDRSDQTYPDSSLFHIYEESSHGMLELDRLESGTQARREDHGDKGIGTPELSGPFAIYRYFIA